MTNLYTYTGPTEAHYTHGKKYLLNVKETRFRHRIKIGNIHGFLDQPYAASLRVYKDWGEFNRNFRRVV